ncbi:NACHT domain-containing protein [Psychrobacter phenylpyruvicus]|uniref:Predicted NTPase (NACHT family) n=3 Tax=Psychrobacter phenylpyruvicus TaxID=29432 RepID=A0A379LLF3_9GAMM|nr:ATP-binding protein [Psychrobacter phenylpyruvicus]SUD91416.1 Predicted NTPase (NACHT family) [Psychrobacter phenylpyruvicus]
MDIKKLCENPECGHIEYKSEWYWDLNQSTDENTDKTKLWGEFIKDILALINSNIKSFGKTRYMIIGFNEKLKQFSNFNLNETNFNILKNKIRSKIDNFISDSEDIDYSIDYEIVDSINIVVFKIEQPYKLHCLTKNIQTKTSDYKQNVILYRGNDGNTTGSDDNVGVMHPRDIRKLESKIKDKYGSKFVSIQNRRTKTISKTIYSYLEKNNIEKLSEGFPKKAKKNGKGYFELYELEKKLDGTKSYFAYISDENIKSSIENLHNSFLKLGNRNNTIHLLVDKPKKTSPEQRLVYIKRTYEQLFSAKINIDFIEDFGKKYLYEEYLKPLAFEQNFPNTENFIESFSSRTDENHESIFATDIIKEWYLEENSPLIVLTGPGGVGKTTVVRNFLNTQLKALRGNSDHYVLFLDSSSLLEQLKSDRISSIYDLYKAEISDSEHFTEELFKLSIDNGSFIIILDGLDEIISGVNIKFQLQDFLNNIFVDYCFNLAKTKIIITCRDYIWEESINLISEDFNIEKLDIKPFNYTQTTNFFEICFKNDIKSQKKSLDMVKTLISKSNETYYSPFMLDTVSDLVRSGVVKSDINKIFDIDNSDADNLCLLKNNILDYLVYAVCKREVKKINVDLIKQIKILCKISEISNPIDKTSFTYIVRDIIDNADDSTVNSLLTHAFIRYSSNRSIVIRYDFLKDFFLRVSIAQHFSNEYHIESNILSSLVSKVSYLNNFSIEIGNRLSKSSAEDLLFYILQVIEQIHEQIELTEDEQLIKNHQLYISNLFILYLGILKAKNCLTNSHDLNQALNDVFSDAENHLNRLYLCNIRDIKNNPKLLFNFSDLTIDNCYIDNYHGFTECKFNDNTLFKTGSISIESINSYKSDLKPENISHQIIKLGKTAEFLDNIKDSLKENTSNKSDALKKFIKLFIKNGRFMPKKVVEVRNKKGGVAVDKMLAIGVITINKNSKLNQDEYIIDPKVADVLYKFWDSGFTSPQIREIVESM